MTFVEHYTAKQCKIITAGNFTESEKSVVYSLGEFSGTDVIVKTDDLGNHIWGRKVQFDGVEGIKFKQIIQLIVQEKPIYIVTAYGLKKTEYYLLAIDANGNEVWTKTIPVNGPQNDILIIANLSQNTFYVAFTQRPKDIKTAYPEVWHFDPSGNVMDISRLFVPDIKKQTLTLKAIGVYEGGLKFAAQLGSKTINSGVFDIDQSLNLRSFTRLSGMRPDDLLVFENGFTILLAYSEVHNALLLIYVDPSLALPIKILPDSARATGVICASEKRSYIVSLLSQELSLIYIFDAQHNLKTRKKVVALNRACFLKTLQFQPQTGRVCFTGDTVSLIGLSKTDFNNCIVEPIRLKSTRDLAPEFELIDGSQEHSKSELPIIPVRLLSRKPRKKYICPPDIVTEPKPEPKDPKLTIDDNALVQSPHLYLQSAGSDGHDSTEGIHLRWQLKNSLINHIPKGNYATTTANFNKAEDYVFIYRAPYRPMVDSFLFGAPSLIVNNQWIYAVGSDVFYLTFLNSTKYDQALTLADPNVDTEQFFEHYGDGLIEFEHKTRLAFALSLEFTPRDPNSNIALEIRSVEDDKISAPRTVTLRGTYTPNQLLEQKLFSENIRSIRFKASQAIPKMFTFEFYDSYLSPAYIKKDQWSFIDKFALTKDRNEAKRRLEPVSNSVRGKWLRYNDDAYLNVDNYTDRWDSPSLPADSRVFDTVEKYISLSDNASNPTAIESYLYNDPTGNGPGTPDPNYDPSTNKYDLSNLFVLQIACMDYPVARQCGLGWLDLEAEILSGQYVYIAQYFTNADLMDGHGKRQATHLYMSLPTGLSDQRLPLPINLKAPVPGIFTGANNSTELTDIDGYSHDGFVRYVSLFHEPLHQEAENAPFFNSNLEFAAANFTMPVYAGLKYKASSASSWRKPELSFDSAWNNIDATVPLTKAQETRPIMLPDPSLPLFIHREYESGWKDISSYGINWFGRATSSPLTWPLESVINPKNPLLPPNNVTAVLIQKEQPLLLTTAQEQGELNAITTTDKTFIRLEWEYTHSQELVIYHKSINGDIVSGYNERPDADEIFADEIDIFFRDQIPHSLGGKVLAINATPMSGLVEVVTGEFVFDSMGTNSQTGPNEVVSPELPASLVANFLGSQLSIDGINYPIHAIDNSGTYPKFTIHKVDNDGNAVEENSTLASNEMHGPAIGSLFAIVENMANTANWGNTNPVGFNVKIEPTTIHREEIVETQPDGTVDVRVHKFRGIYEDALIETVLIDHDGDEIDGIHSTDTPRVHLGGYKLTFDGFSMPQHSQGTASPHHTIFSKGIVRVHSQGDPNGPRKVLKVIQAKNIGSAPNDLILYAVDPSFSNDSSYDPVATGTKRVNYYPGYKTKLFYDPSSNLIEASTLPAGEEDVKYSIFGIRSTLQSKGFHSPLSAPALMFAQNVREPVQPQPPQAENIQRVLITLAKRVIHLKLNSLPNLILYNSCAAVTVKY